MKRTIYALLAVLAVTTFATSCSSSSDPSAPVVQMYASADENDSYTWNFSTQASDANSFTWDFGDGESGEGAEISHTYTKSGEYTVTVTAKGDGGETADSKKITVVAGIEELLTGGPDAKNGKTWKLSQDNSNQNDGVYDIDGSVIQLAPGGALAMFGLGDEYDNEFTFFDGGKYAINPMNSKVLASWSYAAITGTTTQFSEETGLAIATFNAINNGNYTIKTGDLEVEVRKDVAGSIVETKVFKDATWLEFSEGAFFGINTFDTRVVLEEVAADKIYVSILLSTLDPNTYPADYKKPSNLYKFTFDAK
ncbi:MAG: PKD domain-containing protein [Bacteroidales bacterium]